jgi:hypothetical protein
MTFTQDLAREHALRRLDAVATACTSPPVVIGSIQEFRERFGPCDDRSARPMPQHGLRWYTESQDEEWWGDA